MAIVEFPDLHKINFKTLMNGMIFNGTNWVQFRNQFEHAIQTAVPLDLLTTGYFVGSYNLGYRRLTSAQAATDIGLNADSEGAFNVVFMKALIHKLAVSCFDWERFQLYKTHESDLTCYNPSDWHNGARRTRHDWESTDTGPPSVLLDKTSFPEAMNEHYAANATDGKGKGNLACIDADGRSRQASFRLWFDKVFITAKIIKKKQKEFKQMAFTPNYNLEINEASNFQSKFLRDADLCNNTQTYLGGLQIDLEEMLPKNRHDQEDYKSQMNLINNNITTTEQFFTALERVYDYYKSGKVGDYFRNKGEGKKVNFLDKRNHYKNNEKTYEAYDNEKKKYNNFKKNDYAIIPLRNMKCYHCGKRGHLMNECRSKKKEYYKGKSSGSKNFQKERNGNKSNYKSKEYKNKGPYTDKKERKWDSYEKYKKYRESRRNDKEQRNRPRKQDSSKPYYGKPSKEGKPPRQKDSSGQYQKGNSKPWNKDKYKDKKMWCDHCKTDTHFTNSCYKYRQQVEEVEDPMVFNLEQEYSSSSEEEEPQYYESSSSEESEDEETHNLERTKSEQEPESDQESWQQVQNSENESEIESEGDYYF
jgi:hypothetical protein